MNRYDFYSNLQKYNSQDLVNSLKHSELNNKNDFVKTKDGSNWGESYYKKEDLGNGKWRYFYSKEEYDKYMANKIQQASSDNARGAGADYQRYLDAQKNAKQTQNINNNQQNAQVEVTKQKMLDIVNNYNKTTGNKNGANEFNKAVKKLGLETEAGVQKYGGYEAALKAVEEEMNKSINENTSQNKVPVINTIAEYNNMQAETVNKYSEIAKKSPKSAAKEFFKEDAVTELLDDVKEGLKNKTLTIDDTGRFKYSDSKTEESINKELDNLQKWCKWIGTASGTDRQMQKELSDLLQEEFDSYQKEERITSKLDKYSEGGNVDLNNRPEISTEELKKAGWDDVGDGYATVYSSTYSNDDNDTFYNFTPIIVDPKTGKFIGVMSPDEFDDYCYEVIHNLRKDDKNLQIGGAFKGDNALKAAEKAAEKIHKLHEDLSEVRKKQKWKY